MLRKIIMRTRNYHISVWLNAQELEHLKKQSQASGLGMDPFIRQLIMGVQLRPRPPAPGTERHWQ